MEEAKFIQANTGKNQDGGDGETTDRKGEASKIIAVRGKGMDENLKGITKFENCRRQVWKKSK